MLKQIMTIVIRNRRDVEKMTAELIYFLAQYSTTAQRAGWFINLDEKMPSHSMEFTQDTVTHTWRNWEVSDKRGTPRF